MGNSNDIIPGSIVYSFITQIEREKAGFLKETMLAFQISGKLTFETSSQKITTRKGDILLMRKNQLFKLTKTPLEGEDYKIILVYLSEDVLRKYVLEHGIDVHDRYTGKPGIFISGSEFLQGYFQSLIPYAGCSQADTKKQLGILKVKEAVELLLQSNPELRTFLFDFSEPHKIDLEKFMLSNFHFNVPIEKFARLTGRSLAGFKRDFQKTFGASPRHWLQDRRLIEAHYLIQKKGSKISSIYLDLGFESLSHFSNSFKQKYGVAPTELKRHNS